MNKFAIHDVVWKNDLERLRQLIKAGVPVDSLAEDGCTPLHLAALCGHYEVAALLIDSKCDLDIKDRGGRTPVMWAASIGRKDIVDHLLHRGAQVNCVDDNGDNLLHTASSYGWTEIVQLILDNGEPHVNAADKDGDTPLMWAVRGDHEEVVSLLIRAGADLNAVDQDGKTPLIWAVLGGHEAVASLLIRAGADFSAVDQDGDTLLMWTVRGGHEEVASLLIQAGADANRSNVQERTALHEAVMWNRNRVIHILREKVGLDLSPQDVNGDTPLHYSCQLNHREAIKQLLYAGADTIMKNNQGKTALNIGIRRGILTHEVIRLFVQKGAFLENCDYECISRNHFLKENVLTDVELCTQSVVNKFNRRSLPALNSIAYFARRLPNVDNFKLVARHIDEVENLVKCEIERNTFCNVVRVRPIALSALCVLSLITCQSGTKQAASNEFSYSPF